MEKYNPQKIEKKWQEIWAKTSLYETKETASRPKFYALDMFPYPSGDGLHVGHPKGYISTDIISRMKMLQGYEVLHPMGWDAFGLPAENYAIKNKVHPKEAVDKNIQTFKGQLEKIGFTYDWKREINTTDPNYYKWTQWIFLQMFKKGLAYEAFEPINWCPNCKTGLANEDLQDGRCEVCGTEVIRKPLRQWVLKMTAYADKLLEGLDDKENLQWEEQIIEQQRNWIGKSVGTEVDFPIKGKKDFIKVFTTRVDTIFGCTYVMLAPEHPLVDSLKNSIKNISEVTAYVSESQKKSELERSELQKEKTGVKLDGLVAINPFNQEEIPIYVADYVLGGYGTGAVMAVPAHDDRDYMFAKKYGLPIVESIMPKVVDEHDPPRDGVETVFRNAIQVILINPKDKKVLCLKWKKFPWTTFITGGIEGEEDAVTAAKRETLEETGYRDIKFVRTLGGPVESHFYANHKGVNRKALFTALVFELISDKKEEISEEEAAIHNLVWVTWDELKKDKNIKCAEYDIWLDRFFNAESAFTKDGVLTNSGKFTGLGSGEAREKMTTWLKGKHLGGEKVNYKMHDWVFSRQRYWGEPIPIIHCQKCGAVAVAEKDLPVTLPEVENYEPTGTGESPLAAIDSWVNVKCPKCGGKAKRETNTMPQWAGSCWYYLRYLDPNNNNEMVSLDKEEYWMPVDLYVGGAEHATRHLLYARFWHKFLYDIGRVTTKEPFKRLVHVGLILAEDGRKMSKRWKNVINPDDIIGMYGADSLRLYEMFMGPFIQSIAWNTDGLKGIRRFLEKVYELGLNRTSNEWPAISSPELERKLNQTIKKVTLDIEEFRFNTAISSMMELVNAINTQESNSKVGLSKVDFEKFLIILSPFAPHMMEEMWENLGNVESIFRATWPVYDKTLIKDDVITVAVQINGKVRDQIIAIPGATKDEIFALAKESVKTKKYLEGVTIQKVIYVQDKLLSIVIT